MDEPPVAPAVKGTEIVVAFVADTVPIVGAAGTVVAVIAEVAFDVGLVPVALVEVPVKV
jgi:hypothetical protein